MAGVKKFVQPNNTTSPNGNSYAGDIESAISVLSLSYLGGFAPYASTPPAMNVNILGGDLSDQLGIAGQSSNTSGLAVATNLTSLGIQTTSTITAPVSNPRIDRVYLEFISGLVKVVTGIESSSPVAPSYPDGGIPICQVSLSVGQTVITNAHLTDERGTINMDSPSIVNSSNGAFPKSANYLMITGNNTYVISKPPQARFYRVTMVGPGGCGGGAFINAGSTTAWGGGGGGGGGYTSFFCLADDITVSIGSPGVDGANSTPGVNNATSGTAGTDTTITFASTGTVYTAHAGSPGLRGVSTPAGGAGGAGGAADVGGTTGSSGGTGPSGAPGLNPIGTAGLSGEGYMGIIGAGTGSTYGNSATSGFVLIEWF